jgi:hypothetical protein
LMWNSEGKKAKTQVPKTNLGHPPRWLVLSGGEGLFAPIDMEE